MSTLTLVDATPKPEFPITPRPWRQYPALTVLFASDVYSDEALESDTLFLVTENLDGAKMLLCIQSGEIDVFFPEGARFLPITKASLVVDRRVPPATEEDEIPF